jgi:hypothetical protein
VAQQLCEDPNKVDTMEPHESLGYEQCDG